VFAELKFPPCTKAERPTYATVQMGRDEHLDLNSDLLYINHSCEPSLVSLVDFVFISIFIFEFLFWIYPFFELLLLFWWFLSFIFYLVITHLLGGGS